jgi:formylglycine-generating enzyme required for sulfatase activity
MGESLGRLGDPRLRRPSDPDYWAQLKNEESQGLQVGRHAVTVEEFRAWAESGGPEVDAHWSEEGLEWRDAQKGWSELARDPAVAHLLVPNQPVVGVTWFEAEAYARANEARLLSGAEHRMVMRGPDKRPYPWGSPFGEGNANTREESLGRPCAIGLYRSDVTPDGVWDLAGNGAEWLADVLGPNRSLHPGSWARPSMASWAKALDTAPPDTRSADLGFRLARDLG